MRDEKEWAPLDLAALLLVVILAAVTRFWYVAVCTEGGDQPPAIYVQARPLDWSGKRAPEMPKGGSDLDNLVVNLKEHHWFGGFAPLADQEEKTAHVAPAYPWLLSLAGAWDFSDAFVRWGQALLGTLTAVCYFLFSRRAFQSLFAGFLAGVLAAIHPFWIVNTAEIADGVLATFLLAAALALGTRASQVGGAFCSLFFGLALAALVLTRAAFLPFSVIALVWFLVRCRMVPGGWLCALLAFLGLANGLAPWSVRNFREFGEPFPIVDSALLHLWIGNNPQASGGNLDERALRRSFSSERLESLLAEPNQARRYRSLGEDIKNEIVRDPEATVARRLWAGLMFVFGQSWFDNKNLAVVLDPPDDDWTPEWISDWAETALRSSLLLMLAVGLLGWRWSFAWGRSMRLATLATIWLPLPYVLSHADFLSGPRLPLDGVGLCFVAFALSRLIPGRRPQPLSTV